ncbi:MAG TPA: hypothetical protein VKA09_15100 [Nitrososphaeraceae archaeon]|nr:hypothetical protein [Nitrososphaeraceae archaeon]
MAIVHVISASDIAIAQPITESAEGMNVTGNQTTSDLVPYSNPNLGFSLEYPSDWRKESLNFISPQGGIGNRAPEIMSITSEVRPTSDYSLDSYTECKKADISKEQEQETGELNQETTKSFGP